MTTTERLASLLPSPPFALAPSERDAIVAIALIVVAADGKLDPGERDLLHVFASQLDALAGDGAATDVDGQLAHVAAANEGVDVESRIHEYAGALASPDARAAAYLVAYALARSDLETSDEEFVLDLTLVDALDLTNDDAKTIADRVDRALAAG